MSRVFNFSAGPAVLPLPVLERAAAELVECGTAGMSVMEMSHRGKAFQEIFARTKQGVIDLLGVPEDYQVLFLQGGATAQFAMVPMNLLGKAGKADYVNTGVWSQKAIAEARKFGAVNVAASSEATGFHRIPGQAELALDPGAAYCHITTNNTIFGTEYPYTPDTGDVPLVADASSNILSRPMDVARYGLIYAGAQKNLGPSGVTLVVIRKDLVGRAGGRVPTIFDYQVHADADSMYNTPPTYAIYVLGLVCDWLRDQGGVGAIEQVNLRKAMKLYDGIDASDFYACPTEPASRSRMNVPFTLADPDLDATFLAEAAAADLVALKGHRLVGGMRASLYNAMPEAGVDALVAFLQEFERRRG
jgi:phosphoserine aminotransferase